MTWNIPAWSVSVEAFFYVLFPALLARLIHAGKLRLQCLLLLSWGASFIPSLAYLPGLQQNGASLADAHHFASAVLGSSALRRILDLTPLMRLPEFVAGIVLALLFLRRQPDVATNARRWRIEWAAAGVIAAILTVLLIPDRHPYPMLHVAGMLPLWCLLIYLLASSEIVSKAFGLPIIVVLGEISYSIYIFQQPVSNCVRAGLLFATHIMIKGSYPTISLFALYLGVLIAVSFISHYLIEKPAGYRIRGRFAGPVSNAWPAADAPIDKRRRSTTLAVDRRQRATGPL